MRRYSRAVFHMRDQLHENSRFGLVFGAGASKDLKFPQWWELVETIAKHPKVDADVSGYKGSQASVSQRLFQRFKEKTVAELPVGFDTYNKLSAYVQAKWNEIIRTALYGETAPTVEQLLDRDTYLCEFIQVMKDTRLTVTYNFDDTLERFLSAKRTDEEKKTKKGSRTIWSADVQMYSQNAVIYHPNGYLPSVKSERPSDHVIFLEDSFGDQLIESAAGRYSLLTYHFAQNTCLFIGHSLEDSTLKHLLRKNALLYPGHVHYYVYFVDDGVTISDVQQREITEANFEVYNLVTLFLTRKEIAALGSLLSYKANATEIKTLAEDFGCPSHYYYYLTGSVCAGKSTAVSHFRSLSSHDEWLDQKVEGMEKDPAKLAAADKERISQIDQWVVQQWHQKNSNLRHANPGLHVVDRSPLDAFAFTPESEWQAKAQYTKANVTPGGNGLVKGMVVFLRGHPNVMANRAIRLQKDVTPESLDYRQALLRLVFDPDIEGIVVVDTCEKPALRVAKEIARWVHIAPYKPCDLSLRLDDVLSGRLVPSPEKIRELFMLKNTADSFPKVDKPAPAAAPLPS